jgi:ubiquinone/menaquinone biosynthesis C-methylase UbiE
VTNSGKQEAELIVGNYYPKYSTTNLLARYLVQGFLKTLLESVELVEANTCIDLGTGEGLLLSHLKTQFPSMQIISSDISYRMQIIAKKNNSLQGVVASAEMLPFANETVDLVTACEVLEHLHQPKQALTEIRRVTRRFCILSVPREPLWRVMNLARFSYVRHWGNTPGHVQHWSKDGFVRLVSTYFKVIEVRSPLPWTFVIGEK